MSDLRETLAETLYRAYCGLHTEYGNPRKLADISGDRDASADQHRKPWYRAADECIRQMEWARARRLVPANGTPAPLTIAPDDWTPTPTKE